MPYYAPGDPYPRKTPAELQAEEDAKPVVQKISDGAEQFASREPDYVWAAICAFFVIACCAGAAFAAHGCT